MNVPGGKASSSRFLSEMEAETGLRLRQTDDPDAGTGARLLTARDVVTGMRFTLRYIDWGFTRAANSCADRGAGAGPMFASPTPSGRRSPWWSSATSWSMKY